MSSAPNPVNPANSTPFSPVVDQLRKATGTEHNVNGLGGNIPTGSSPVSSVSASINVTDPSANAAAVSGVAQPVISSVSASINVAGAPVSAPVSSVSASVPVGAASAPVAPQGVLNIKPVDGALNVIPVAGAYQAKADSTRVTSTFSAGYSNELKVKDQSEADKIFASTVNSLKASITNPDIWDAINDPATYIKLNASSGTCYIKVDGAECTVAIPKAQLKILRKFLEKTRPDIKEWPDVDPDNKMGDQNGHALFQGEQPRRVKSLSDMRDVHKQLDGKELVSNKANINRLDALAKISGTSRKKIKDRINASRVLVQIKKDVLEKNLKDKIEERDLAKQSLSPDLKKLENEVTKLKKEKKAFDTDLKNILDHEIFLEYRFAFDSGDFKEDAEKAIAALRIGAKNNMGLMNAFKTVNKGAFAPGSLEDVFPDGNPTKEERDYIATTMIGLYYESKPNVEKHAKLMDHAREHGVSGIKESAIISLVEASIALEGKDPEAEGFIKAFIPGITDVEDVKDQVAHAMKDPQILGPVVPPAS